MEVETAALANSTCAVVWESSHYDIYTFICSCSINTYLLLEASIYVLLYTIYLTLAVAILCSSFTVSGLLAGTKNVERDYTVSSEHMLS